MIHKVVDRVVKLFRVVYVEYLWPGRLECVIHKVIDQVITLIRVVHVEVVIDRREKEGYNEL